ncbi:hypothetical protein ACSBR1_002085 [Camellia fascicularis]
METKEKKPNNKAPHVLVLPFPAQGHINPMLQFCKRLVSKNIKATLANTISISTSIHSNPTTTTTTTTTSPIDVYTISDGYDHGGLAKAESPAAYLKKFRVVGSQTLADLINKLAHIGHPVDALVYDAFLPWALDVAKQFGIVGAVFFTQSCAVNSIYYHVYEGILSLPLSGETVLVPGLPQLQPCEMPSFVYSYGSYPAFYDMLINQFSNIQKADWVFFNTFYQLEEEEADWMAKLWRARTIGPTIPSMYLDKQLKDDKDYGINLFNPNSNVCINWLNAKPINSVIYVSFGSMAEIGFEQMQEIALCLKEIEYNFLWVVRGSEEAKLPNKFADETSEKGMVVTWCPQLEVLAHESTGCFVTHCGFNSVLEALGLGVPMVAMPQWTDQSTNAKYVEDVWGVGLRARCDEKGIVRKKMLQECIREVMEGEGANEIKKNVIKWKKLAKEAVDEGGSSDKNIEEFVAELLCS